MKIVQIVTRMDEPGGAQRHVQDLCIHLRARGHEVILISGSKVLEFPALTNTDIECICIKSLVRNISPLADLRAYFEIMRIIKRLKPDLIATHSSKAGMIGRAVGWSQGIPTVFTAHGWAFTEGVSRSRQSMYAILERLAGRISSGIIAVSHYDYDLALKNRIINYRKLAVVQNGVMDDCSLEKAKPDANPPKIVMVARFAPPKNHIALINALNSIRDRDWEVFLLGDGPLREEAELHVKRLELDGRIKFLGSRSDVSPILSVSQLFVLISKWEGLPLSILEAMRSGLPIVASDVGGVKEAVIHGINGFLIPPGNSQALADRLEQLITSPDLRAKMGGSSRKRYEDHFTFARMIKETEQFYKKVVKTHENDLSNYQY